jgi:hypothetical protein
VATGLSFEQAPPLSVPYRFFLAAPCSGVLAGLLLAWSGGDALASRWAAQALALTHLIALGFMLQAMSGALLQFIPVAVGGNVWRPRFIAWVVQPLLLVATLMLVAGWLGAGSAAFALAVPIFILAIGALAVAATIALWRTPATGMTLWTMRLAVGGLVATVLLGSLLAEALAQGLVVPFLLLTDIHLAWGLGGWALMLLAAVSYHVVPMFQLTRPYPLWFARAFGPLLLALLLAWSAQLVNDAAAWPTTIAVAMLGASSVYAVLTLWLQHTRLRKIDDATSLYFRVAMLSLLGFAVSGVALLMLPALAGDPRAAVWLGVLALVGVFVSAITGMMYKILPFLNWLHLQRLGAPMSAVPNMKKMIPAAAMMGQFRLHLAALALLLLAVWQPLFARPAGVALAASFGWLGWILLGAARRYRGFKAGIVAAL